MGQKSITQILCRGDVNRVVILNSNNTMMLSSKKSDCTRVLSPKLAIFDNMIFDMVLYDFFDDSIMVLLELKITTR